MTKVIALTGGTGSGQSTVGYILAQKYRCKVINADEIAKQIINNNSEVKKSLKNEFGYSFFTHKGSLKRKEFGSFLFKDKSHVQRLNKIVHPVLVHKLIEEVEEAQETKKFSFIVIDAALIYEMAIERYFDFVIVVSATKENRIKRIIQRDAINRQQVTNRMNSQFSLTEKKKWADFVIENNSTLEELEKRIHHFFHRIKKELFNKKNNSL